MQHLTLWRFLAVFLSLVSLLRLESLAGCLSKHSTHFLFASARTSTGYYFSTPLVLLLQTLGGYRLIEVYWLCVIFSFITVGDGLVPEHWTCHSTLAVLWMIWSNKNLVWWHVSPGLEAAECQCQTSWQLILEARFVCSSIGLFSLLLL